MLDLDALSEKAASLQQGLPAMDPQRELHIDGDYCAYFFSGNDETPIGAARRKFAETLMDVRRVAGAAGRTIVHLTAGGSHKGHRYQIATVKPYQGQRSDSRKPKNWADLRMWAESYNHKKLPGTELIVHIWQDREADDGVSVSSRYAYEQGRTLVIFMRDKDSHMVYGEHITWDELDTVKVPPGTWELFHGDDEKAYGLKWFYHQLVMGDSADNIPGVPGIPKLSGDGHKACGHACAKGILATSLNAGQAAEAVQQAYQEYWGAAWPQALAEQAMLLWLRNDNKADMGNFINAFPLSMHGSLNAAIRQIRSRVNATR